ncbi:HLH transcription factor [Colletotrichum tofieldiae]|nr:HLH transcription factor [Colletotrichum tofieldiae]GKT72529.1 HLH transcription factor [Colletotrichum tofieldiae]
MPNNQKFSTHSIRRAATRATLTSSVSAAVAAPKSQTISSAVRALNAAAISARYFSVAAPKAFSRSVAFRDEQQNQQEEDSQAPREQRQPRQDPSEHVLFVQNYSFDVKPDDLSEAFSKYGEVVGVSMPPKRTFCFVYFKDAESVATAAENVDGTFWHGRRIVAKSRPAGGERPQGGRRDSGDRRDNRAPRVSRAYDGPPTNTLYVGNIAFEASDADLNNLFSTLKDVTDVRVAVDRATGWPRGFAHADFASTEAATAAIEALKGVQVRGRDLKIAFAPASNKETGRTDRQNRKSRYPREGGNNRSRDHKNSQKEVEERVEVEHKQAEEAQTEQKPEAGKQDMNWNA